MSLYCAGPGYQKQINIKRFMAEREGFEPSVRCRTHAFQACSFGLSDTSPEIFHNAFFCALHLRKVPYTIKLDVWKEEIFGDGSIPGISKVPCCVAPHPTGYSHEEVFLMTTSAPPSLLRKPAVAGQFYPDDPQELRAVIETFSPPQSMERLSALAVIAPHAGYVYSGRVVAETFAQAVIPETAIILGPNHHGLGERVAIMANGRWQLPGAVLEIDSLLASRLMAESPLLHDDALAHSHEHSLEVQVPFLHYHGLRRFVPICVSFLPYDICLQIGEALARTIQKENKPILLVASTDMTHYESRTAATQKDHLALQHILALDPEGLYQTVLRDRISMCGIIPTTITLIAAKRLGATKATLIRYTDSGEVSGDTRQVVGYAGLVIS
jgi:AmmeMemoRadiSam system protein B